MKNTKIIVLTIMIVLVLFVVAGVFHFDIIKIQESKDTSENPEKKYFGNEAYGDFDADGKLDKAFLYTENGGGSGTFFYVTAILDQKGQARETNSIFLGDRIAPQNTYFADGNIVVNYADRRAGEPMTEKPSLGVSRYFIVEDKALKEIIGYEENPADLLTAKDMCFAKGGSWDAEYSECGGIDKISCEAIGGYFNECASACRHNPKAEVCTLQCVIICEIR